MNNFSGLHLFYTPGIQSHHEAFILSEEESKHAIRVLRLTAGEHIRLVDGRGGSFRAAIADAHPKRTVLTILEATTAYQKRPYRLHVAIAPTKRIERLEWFLEKATEVGIDEVTPVICDRSERKEVKPDRLRKVAVAAMKQSQNAYLPAINPPVRFTDFIGSTMAAGHGFIAHCAASSKQYLTHALPRGAAAVVLIGPEGDFSPAEIETARRAGYVPITLGSTRLRTETAAMVACTEVAILNRE